MQDGQLILGSQAPHVENKGSTGLAKGKNRASFWSDIDTARKDSLQLDDQLNVLSQDEDDFIAPSPVKPRPNGKGNQRAPDPVTEAVTKPSTKDAKASFFSVAGLPVTNRATDAPQYTAGPSKPKKRTIAAAALVPMDNLGDPEAPASSEIPFTISSEAEPAMAKRPKRTTAKALDVAEDSAKVHVEQSVAAEEAADDPIAPEAESENKDEDYEVRELDEYEPYDARSKRATTPMAAPADQWSRRSVSAVPDLDESLDPTLVSLLSLKTSPVKNRLAKLHKKRDDTVQKVLQEPTYLIAQKKALATQGLEDLEDDEYEKKRIRRMDDEGEHEASDGEVSGDERAEQLAENSDDDWASEPDGWKDLGDGEMDYDDL